MRDTAAALHWILDILEKLSIPYQISGGAAARLYGSTRELADIDIDVPQEALERLLPLVKDHLNGEGIEHYTDDEWDLLYLPLIYAQQEIELLAAGTQKIYNKEKKMWEELSTDIENSVQFEWFGRQVCVIPKEELLAYKRKIMRPVDVQDIEELS